MILTKFDAQHLQIFFIGGAHTLQLNKATVDALNVFPVPDGDTGTNMSLTVSAAAKEIKNAETNDIRLIAKDFAHGALMGARGNSGVIFSQIARGISQSFSSKEASPIALAKALKKGADLAYQSVMKPVEGTILTVIREMADAAVRAAHEGADCLGVLEAAVHQGEKALAYTPQLLPALKQAGVVDAGGKGLLFIFYGGIAALKGESVTVIETDALTEQLPVYTASDEACEYGYCTEFILRGEALSIQHIRTKLQSMGDSLLAVGDENTVKVHIHTLHPGNVLEFAISLGTLHDIKIDNMGEQHSEIKNEIPKKQLAIVAVAAGDGMEEIFSSLGVASIVQGGQSMNPSTEELLNAVKQVHAEEIILLPNNKNIIPTAEQVHALSESKIHVIPTKNMLEGISALTVYEVDRAVEDNVNRMKVAYKHITSVEITYAVRDTEINGLSIQTGNILALVDGAIKLKGKTAEEVLLEAIKSSIKEEHEIVTLFFGEGIEPQRVKELQQEFYDTFPELELEIHRGGQPIYYYIASIE